MRNLEFVNLNNGNNIIFYKRCYYIIKRKYELYMHDKDTYRYFNLANLPISSGIFPDTRQLLKDLYKVREIKSLTFYMRNIIS